MTPVLINRLMKYSVCAVPLCSSHMRDPVRRSELTAVFLVQVGRVRRLSLRRGTPSPIHGRAARRRAEGAGTSRQAGGAGTGLCLGAGARREESEQEPTEGGEVW